ncbi:MAG: ABC transporter ATP-binding protein, partial [Bacteroidales bacterium]|nr:ABC transporter ATP-binding protein [Bacteroidales bacterium]
VVKDFIGSYSDYREYIKAKEKEKKSLLKQSQAKEQKGKEFVFTDNVKESKRKLSFKEKREFEQLEGEIEALEREKKELEEALSGGKLSTAQLQEASVRIGVVMDELDTKSMRWLELSEYAI